MNQTVFDALQVAFAEMWAQVIMFTPTLVVALLVLLVGVIIASSLKHLIERVARKLAIDQALSAAGMTDVTTRLGMNLNTGVLLGTMVKWFVLLVFFVVALDMLRLTEVTTFLREVVIGYLPNVIVAVLILVVATILAGAVRKAIVHATGVAGMVRPELFGKVAYVAIITVAVLAALNQLKVAADLIQPLFTGIVFAISLALGLAFGLGGKDAAARLIDSVTKK
jgi:hypothetical protein